MPKVCVEYLKRPVRQGRDERQRARLLAAASRALKRKPIHPRAMLILRLNQPHVTWEEARAQFERIHGTSRTLHRWPYKSEANAP
jgi:hypothetical protein